MSVWWYADALGATSWRRLERRIREDLAFRYGAGGAQPDPGTLNEFRGRHPKALHDLFTQVVELARAAGLGRLVRGAMDWEGERFAEPGGKRGGTARGASADSSPDSAWAAGLECRRPERRGGVGATSK